MIIDWSTTATPTMEINTLASALLNFLFVNSYNDRRDMYKSNLELTKLFIEAWKDYLEVPFKTLYCQITLPPVSKKLHAGVHLTAILLANKLVPWERDEIKNFLKALCKVLQSDQRTIYQPAAEVIGMALQLVKDHAEYGQYFNKFFTLVQSTLKKCNNDDKFAYCLEGIVLHYPAIADTFFLCKVMANIRIMQGSFKALYVRILLAHTDILVTMSDFRILDFGGLLEDSNTDVHIVTLELISKCLNYFSLVILKYILEKVAKFANCSNIICRQLMYDIFMKTHDKYSNTIDDTAVSITKLSKQILLNGLIDKNIDSREKVYNFWSTCKLPTKLHDRLSYILKELYIPSTEQEYLSYCTYMLLDVLKNNEDFKQKLFEYPLYNCTFEEYKLYGHWRAQHASVIPLFADTLRSQNIQSDHFSNVNLDVLRATQSGFAFTPTQTNAYGTLQASLYSKVSSSLSFILNEETDNTKQTFKDPNKIDISHKYRKRRFHKDRSKISRHFAYEEVKKAGERDTMRKNLAKEKERGVTFYRKYRSGDFPDIEITLGDVLLPLQMLSNVRIILLFHFLIFIINCSYL